MTAPEDWDEQANNLVAAGALYAILDGAGDLGGPLRSVNLVDDRPTNQIDVRFNFLKSAYRITIERIPDERGTDG